MKPGHIISIPPPRNIPVYKLYAYRCCGHNALSALLGRVFMSVPSADPQSIEQVRLLAKKLAWKFGHIQRCTYDQVINGYHGSKRRRYQQAYDNMVQGRRQPKGRLTCFTKIETAQYKFDKKKPACRAIQFRDYEYTLELATYIKPIEHVIYSLKDTVFGVGRTIYKNLNQRQRGDDLWATWRTFKNPYAIMLDAHRYDAHCNVGLLSVEQTVYLQIFKGDSNLKRLLQKQLLNKGKVKVGHGPHRKTIDYQVVGRRCSGDINTALGNCIIMIFALKYAFDKLGIRYSIKDDGDDSVVITEGKPDVDSIIASMLELGLVMEVEGVTNVFEEITFCQSNPVWIDDTYVMVRNPVRSISKALSNPKYSDPRSLFKRLRTVALGELSLNQGVPVCQHFFHKLYNLSTARMSGKSLRRSEGLDVGILSDYNFSRKLGVGWKVAKTSHISFRTRESFSRAFGIPVEAQLAFEASILEWDLPNDMTPVHHQGLNPYDWTWHPYFPELDSGQVMGF